MTVTLYSKPDCWPCRQAERVLNQSNVPFVKVDVTEDEEAYQRLVRNGFMSTPVISYGGRMVSIDGLRDVITEWKSRAA